MILIINKQLVIQLHYCHYLLLGQGDLEMKQLSFTTSVLEPVWKLKTLAYQVFTIN